MTKRHTSVAMKLRSDASGVGIVGGGGILKIERNPSRTTFGVSDNTIIFDAGGNCFVGSDHGSRIHTNTFEAQWAIATSQARAQGALPSHRPSLELIHARNNPPLQPTELTQNPATGSRWRWALPDGFFVSKKRQYVDQAMRPAIYVLFQGEEVVYVGQSINVYSRLGTHYQEGTKEFDSFRILYCKKKRMSYWERKLIKAYEPRYNVSQNRRKAKALGYKTPNQRMKEIVER